MTQEQLMKGRMIRARILFIITLIALLIFIGLYIDETHRVQETYRAQFITCMTNVSSSIDSYLDAEGDLPLRYRRILSDLSNANCFTFLITAMTDEQKIAVNELYTCFLKYPEQMQDTARLKEVQKAANDMGENLDKGFEEAKKIVDSIDKKGF